MRLDQTDMPKLQSPFVREEINGRYVCTPEIDSEYKWVFESSIATDKLDGTNVSVWIVNGRISAIYNRLNEVDLWTGDEKIISAVREAIKRGYIRPAVLNDGGYYGEVIGEGVQSNPYKLQGNIFLPFEKIRTDYEIKHWQEIIKELKGKSDQEVYDTVSEFFKGLWSVFALSRGIKGKVDENTGFGVNGAAEGLVFHSADGKMAKLRRDMFDWYTGREHGR